MTHVFRGMATAMILLIEMTQGAIAMSNLPSSTDTNRILLSCPDQTINQQALCDAMEQVLAEAAPNHTISREVRTIGEYDLVIMLRVTTDKKHSLKAYAEWQIAGSEVSQGPEIEVAVMDATVSPHMFVRFLSDLVRVSAIPID